MKNVLTTFLICLGFLSNISRSEAQTSTCTITTAVGTGTQGFSGDGGLAASAELNAPRGFLSDTNGNFFIVDTGNNRIRKVDANGIITTIAGTGTAGSSGVGGLATAAELSAPHLGLAMDTSGSLLFSDTANHRILKIDSQGIVTSIVGTGQAGFSGDGGSATSAQLTTPYGIVFDATGNLYISDRGNQRIRKVDVNGTISTVAGTGTGTFGGDGGLATSAQLNSPRGLAIDSSGNLLIADDENFRVRKVDSQGIITTVAGTGTQGSSGDNGPATAAEIDSPKGIATDVNGNFYIAVGDQIRKIDASGTITTLAGTGAPGFSGDNGPPESAELDFPYGISLDQSGNFYIADTENQKIRKISCTSGSSAGINHSGPSSSNNSSAASGGCSLIKK